MEPKLGIYQLAGACPTCLGRAKVETVPTKIIGPDFSGRSQLTTSEIRIPSNPSFSVGNVGSKRNPITWEGVNNFINNLTGTASNVAGSIVAFRDALERKRPQEVKIVMPDGRETNLKNEIDREARSAGIPPDHLTLMLLESLKNRQNDPPPQKDNTLLYVGIGGGVLVLMMMMMIMMNKK